MHKYVMAAASYRGHFFRIHCAADIGCKNLCREQAVYEINDDFPLVETEM